MQYSMMSTISFIYDQNSSPPNERIPAPMQVLTEIKKKSTFHIATFTVRSHGKVNIVCSLFGFKLGLRL